MVYVHKNFSAHTQHQRRRNLYKDDTFQTDTAI